jgi:hypothetical protein
VLDETHIEKMIALMNACHGDHGEMVARKRANRCLRRREPEWAALWREVAERIARAREPSASTTPSPSK